MNLDEHLLCFMIDQHGLTNDSFGKQIIETLGTRDEIEKSLLQFLYNLKYYSTRWMRAKLYCEIVGFL